MPPRTAIGLGRAAIVEHRKLFRRWGFWFLLGLQAAWMLLVFGGGFTVATMLAEVPEFEGLGSAVRQTLSWPWGLAAALQLGTGVGQFLLLVFAVRSVGLEYTWRTVQLFLTQGLARRTMLLARFATLATTAALLLAISLVPALIFSAAIGPADASLIPARVFDWGVFAASVGHGLLSMLLYAAFGGAVGVLGRATQAASSIAIVYVLFIEKTLVAVRFASPPGTWPHLAQYLPFSLAEQMLRFDLARLTTNADVNALFPNFPLEEPGLFFVVIAAYVVLFVVLAIGFFERQDLPG